MKELARKDLVSLAEYQAKRIDKLERMYSDIEDSCIWAKFSYDSNLSLLEKLQKTYDGFEDQRSKDRALIRKLQIENERLKSEVAEINNEQTKVAEACATLTWFKYAETCKNLNLNPHHHGEWLAATSAIRNGEWKKYLKEDM